MTRILVIILSVIALAACSRTLDDKLVRVNRLANENLADSAMQALDSIDRASLDEYNRHYYDLMTVKTCDKADFQFDSDSLVLSAMEYFKKNGTDTVRAEAFYYAGRVARMLGDSPQALDYMQNALNCLDDSHTRLKGKISSQMGQIFVKFDLFEQAKIRFNDAILYNLDSNDSLALMYNYRNMAEVSTYLGENDNVIPYYNKSLQLIDKLCPNGVNKVETLTSIADFYIINESYDKACDVFTHIEPYLNENYISSYVLITAMQIYLLKQNFPSSMNIANALLHTSSIYNKKMAYNTLSEISRLSGDKDNTYKYTIKYKNTLDSISSMSSKEAIIHQNSIYNYALREQENQSLKIERLRLRTIIYIVIILSLAVCLVLSYLYFKNKRIRLELTLQLQNIEKLKYRQQEESNIIKTRADDSIDAIKGRIISEYRKLTQQLPPDKMTVHDDILHSKVYCKIKTAQLDSHIKLLQDDWNELDFIVNKAYPGFKSNIYSLYHKISDYEYQVCMLIKCRISNNDIAALTFHHKSSVTSTRIRLFEKLFLHKGSASDFDTFIYSL